MRFQIFFDVGNAVDGIGDADGVRLAQFVMHQQFAHQGHSENPLSHAPDLSFGQLQWRAEGKYFVHFYYFV